MLLSSAFPSWGLITQISLRKHTEFSNQGVLNTFPGFFWIENVDKSVCIVGLIKILYSGWLLIAEVKSRLDPKTGGADPNKFIKAVCELGFTQVSKVSFCSFHSH